VLYLQRMSVRFDGRSRRVLRSASIAIHQLKSGEQMSPIHETNKKAIVMFLFIVFGGTLLTLGTILNSKYLYWLGAVGLFWTALYLLFQSSKLKSPCSPQ